jgi:hypothetical protein
MPLPDRAIMVAGDLHRWMGAGSDATNAAAGAQPAQGSRIQNLLQHALALLGTPYRWGGTGADGFDCSGLVGYVFHSALGIDLPRVSRDMATTGELVTDRAKLSPGDLVFFGHRGRVSHVGIYVGEGRFLHAPRTGRDVTVIAVSRMLHPALAAAERLAADGISVEVIDPRTLTPLDEATLIASVAKTGGAVIVDEGYNRFGATAELASVLAYGAFDYLDAPIERLGALDVPIPFSPPLEFATIPDEARIIAAVQRVLDGRRR